MPMDDYPELIPMSSSNEVQKIRDSHVDSNYHISGVKSAPAKPTKELLPAENQFSIFDV